MNLVVIPHIPVIVRLSHHHHTLGSFIYQLLIAVIFVAVLMLIFYIYLKLENRK